MWWVNYWIMCDLIQAPTPDKGQLIIFFSLVSLYNLSKNEYSIFLPLRWVDFVWPHAGPHPPDEGLQNILFLLVSFHIIPKNEYSTFLFRIPPFQKVHFLFQWKTVYLIIHKFTLMKWKNIKRGGSLDKFLLQILFPHWSKWKAHDKILGSDWSREDMIQLKATAPKENDVFKTNISTFYISLLKSFKITFHVVPWRKCKYII